MKAFLSIFFFSSFVFSFGQTEIIMLPNNNNPGFLVTYFECNANFYDTGGPDNPYGYGENSIATFCPIEVDDKVRINFSLFDLQANHVLRVYDGDTDSDPIIGTFSNVFQDTQDYEFIPSANNSSGCLTVTFFVPPSDFTSQPYQGWSAQISCITCNYPIVNTPQDVEVCSTEGEFASVNLNTEERRSEIIGNQTNISLSYHLSQTDASTGTNPLTGEFNFNQQTTIYIRVEDNTTGCANFTTLALNYYVLPQINLQDQYLICVDENGNISSNPIVLDSGLNPENYAFQWFLEEEPIAGATNPSIEVDLTGAYTLSVIDEETTCEAEFTTNVVPSNSAVEYNIEITPEFYGNSRTVVVSTLDNDEYFYSIDGGEFNTTGTFTNVSVGLHRIRIWQDDGCVDFEIEVFILNFRTFFTPNGDGINDYWNITNCLLRHIVYKVKVTSFTLDFDLV